MEANDLLLFATVVAEGSFTRAAERLNMPKSTLSRRLAQLEAELGERLLLRTTRKLSLSDFGLAVLQHAQQVQDEVAATLALSAHRQSQPSGRLRISLSGDMAQFMAKMFAEFSSAYPQLELELDLSPHRVDLIAENFDLALRIGDLEDDASLAARKLADFAVGVYVAPSYLNRQGMLHEPQDLLRHTALHLLPRSGVVQAWTMQRGEQVWQGLPPGRIRVNSPRLLVSLALQGAGVIMLAQHFAQEWVNSGELVQVLSDWNLARIPFWAVFPGRRLMPTRTRALLDTLQLEFAGARCQALHVRRD